MKCHVLIPNLFLPAREFRIDPLPNLETVLARGAFAPNETRGLEEWLCRAFGVDAQRDWPVAALSRTEPGFWLRADPVHLQLRRDHLVMLGADILHDEAAQLIETLNTHFGPEGLVFYAEQPDSWLVRLTDAPDLSTMPLMQVMGRDVDPSLPKGSDAMRIIGIMNEIQMLFHDHPVNSARDFPINSVWFWGGGIAPDVKPSRFSSVSSKNPLAAGLAKRSGTRLFPIPDNGQGWLASLDEGEHLVILEDLMLPARYGDGNEWDSALRRLEVNWFEPLHRAVQGGLDLVISDNECGMMIETGRRDLWKFWKKTRPILDYLK